MPNLAADYLSEPTNPANFRSAGYVAILRYLRATTAAQVQADLAAGLGVGMIDETAAQEATFASGTADGQRAVAEMQGLGGPAGAVVFVNVGDFAATPAQMPAIINYYNQWASVVRGAGYVPGGYGTAYIIQQLANAGCSGLWWQNAMDDQGVPGNIVTPQASLYQRVVPTLSVSGAGAGSWDEDVILASIPWWGAAPPPPPSPPLEPTVLSPIPVSDYSSALQGTPPAPGSNAFYIQAGTNVFKTNAGGGIVCTFPEPFPNGLLTVTATVGDRSPGSLMGLTLIGDQCSRQWFGAILENAEQIVANGLVRVNWIAIGF